MSAIPVETLARSVLSGCLALAIALGAGIGDAPAMAQAQQNDAVVQRAVFTMETAAGAALDITRSPVTGLATFVAAKPGQSIPTFAPPQATAEERGRLFLDRYGDAFGISARDQVQLDRILGPDTVGMEHVRFRQVYQGIKVRGGEIIVHLRATDARSVTAKTLDNLDGLNTVPVITAAQAKTAAQQVLLKHLNVSGAVLSTPTLEIFNRGLLDGTTSPTRLAWFIEARKADMREFIWVDAQRGAILLHFNQIADAKNRAVHSANNASTLPGTLIRREGGAATADTDVNNAYDFSGDTYDYFFSQHGRDSFDGAGAKLTSTVHYCPNSSSCPYANAFWNGSQMVYGNGYSAADDVVAHELTHALTERSAGLLYYMQSGALNESFSDIFGETVDLTNAPHGTDTPAVRWLMGEDVPVIGAFRNMMNPNAFNDPAKVSDPQFVCNFEFNDFGGVHSNSGVPNHAYALMADGGTFNGQTISGVGLAKAGKMQYRALTQYLVSTADFQAANSAVQQACTDLVGTAGITAADCGNVEKAMAAVEMNSNNCSPAEVPTLCLTGQSPSNVFFDDLENIASGKWATTKLSGVNHWTECLGTPNIYCQAFPTSGSYSFWGYNYSSLGNSAVAMTTSVAIPSVNPRLQFNHSFDFDHFNTSYYDGGVLEYSTNGGSTWTDAGSLIVGGANYGGVIAGGFSNPLAGRSAFVGGSAGYTASQLNLSSLAGQSVRFRFREGTDSSISDLGWLIDDVRIYSCAAGATTLSLASNLNPATLGQAVRFTATVSPATATGTVTFKDGTAPLCSGSLFSGTAVCDTASLTVGSHSMTAVYGGDAGYTGSASAVLDQAVKSPPPIISRYQVHYSNTPNMPWAVGVEGSYFTRESYVTMFDTNGTQWGEPVRVTYVNENSVTFEMPESDNKPPSQCNVGRSCTITMKTSSENGVSAAMDLVLPQIFVFDRGPVISRAGVNMDYEPWVFWVLGSYFTPTARVILFDADPSGTQWGDPIPVSFGGETGISFQLPSNIPPSRCNVGRSCVIKMKITTEFGTSATADLKLPVEFVNAPPPSIQRLGVVTDYDPWVVWVNASYCTRNSTVTLIDADNTQWGDPIPVDYSDETGVNFQLPANIPPSRCNDGRSCIIKMKITTEFGTSATADLKLPVEFVGDVPPPSIQRLGVVTDYDPWVIWVNASYCTRNSTVTLIDADNTQWGDPIPVDYSDETGINFQLPANIPPSRCNDGRSCIIKMKITTEFGTSAATDLEIPAAP